MATDTPGPMRFRGPTYDAAVQAAEEALGARPNVVAANRVRRGGIGGFFATEMGVEVEVTVPGETLDEAVERLVEAGSAQDRAAWIRELARAAGVDDRPTEPTSPAEVPAPPAEVPAPAPAAVADDVPATPTGRTSSTPTRHHVDLAVIAATEMIRLTGDQVPDAKVTVQVTVTTADGRSVAAEAHVETPRATPRTARRAGAST